MSGGAAQSSFSITADLDEEILAQLVKSDKLDAKQAENVKLSSYNSGKRVIEILKDKNLVKRGDVARAKAAILGIPFADLTRSEVSPEVIQYLPEVVARRHTVFPFDYDDKRESLAVAMTDPSNLQIVDFLEKKTGLTVIPHLSDEEKIKAAIEEYYTEGISDEVIKAVKESRGEVSEGDKKAKTLKRDSEDIIQEAPVAKIVSTLLKYAVESRSSDIHIEPLEDRTRVRYRIDGILHERLTLPRAVHAALVSRIKILSNMKIDERRVPQDGRFNFKLDEQEVDLRVSTLPTVNGEKVVMRLLRKSGGIPPLPDLGLRGSALKNLETNILRPYGIILVTGPTGSGKTTTLYSVLSKLNTTKVNIMTLEDPVEYQIQGINQVQINPAAGLTFASGLRSFLRQDPNIILVGEIRDAETSQLAVQAALTGHLVFSTVHTNSAAGAIPRMIDMGVEPFLLSSSLNCIVGQRIVRRICNVCNEEYQPPREMVEDIKKVLGSLLHEEGELKLRRAKGCAECGQSGYKGRIGIFEVLPVTDKIANMVIERTDSGKIEKEAVANGMITMLRDGYLKVLEGITTIEEVLRVAKN